MTFFKTAVAVVVLTSGLACGNKNSGGLKLTTCTTVAQCATGQLCQNSVCVGGVAGGVFGGTTTNTVTCATGTCPSNYVCSTCSNTPGCVPAGAVDCCDGYYCQPGSTCSTTTTPPACLVAGTSVITSVVYASNNCSVSCGSGCCPANQYCYTNSSCWDSSETAPCQANGPIYACPVGTTCGTTANSCTIVPGITCGQFSCSGTDICSSCNGNEFCSPVGSTCCGNTYCSSDSTCCTDSGGNGFCVPSGSVCCGSSYCASGQTCTSSNTCAAGPGHSCDGGVSCGNGTCIANPGCGWVVDTGAANICYGPCGSSVDCGTECCSTSYPVCGGAGDPCTCYTN